MAFSLPQSADTIQQEAAIARKERLSKMLAEQFRASDPNQVVSGRVVALNPLTEALKGLGRAYAMKKDEEVIDDKTKLKTLLAEQQMAGFKNLFGGGTSGALGNSNMGSGVGTTAMNMAYAGIDPSQYISREFSSTNEQKNAQASGFDTPLDYQEKLKKLDYDNRKNLQDDNQYHDIGMEGLRYKNSQSLQDDRQSFAKQQKDNELIYVTVGGVETPMTQSEYANLREKQRQGLILDGLNSGKTNDKIASDLIVYDNEPASNPLKGEDSSSEARRGLGENPPDVPAIGKRIYTASELADIEANKTIKINDANNKSKEEAAKKAAAQKLLTKYREELRGSEYALQELDRQEKLLSEGINAGGWGGMAQFVDKYLPTVEKFDIGNADKASRTEQFSNASLGQGIDALKNFSGGDTDRDVALAIQSAGGDLSQDPKTLLQSIQNIKEKYRLKQEALQKAQQDFDATYGNNQPSGQPNGIKFLGFE